MQRVWFGKKPIDLLLRLLLLPLSGLYWLGWSGYLALYRLGLKKTAHPHRPILCVGNLTTGGSGKSPTVLHLARVLQDLGWQVVIGCSGYGSPRAEAATIAPEGALEPSQWGDEPAMIREALPDVPLIVGRRRVLAAELCDKQFPGAVLLMDDGFQHLPLRKDISILLDSPSDNRFVLPAGPYREPRSNLARADLVLPNEFALHYSETVFRDAEGTVVERPSEANVLCALGTPHFFLRTLEAQGVKLLITLSLPDHDPLSAGNLFRGLDDGAPIIVTTKDWVKIKQRADHGQHRILTAEHTVRIEPAAEFRAWLQEKLDGKSTKGA